MPNALDELAARIAALEEAAREQRRSSTLAYSSIDDGALTVTSAGKLRAVIGQQPDGTTAVNLVNGPVPAVPSKPTAAPTLGGVRVTWDGKFADGSPGPMDLVRVEVHAAPAPGTPPSPATLITTIDTPQGGTVTVPATAPVWVALVARTTSGRASAPSATATAGPAVVVAQEVMAGIIGDLQLAAGAVTAAKVAAGAIDDRAIAEAAVTAAKIGQDAVTLGKIAQNAVTAGAVAADAITAREIVAGAITAAELAAGAVTTASLAAGSVTAAQIAANSVTASKLAANAVTASSIAADAVAAGTIAAGSVTGREIRALSITTDKLAVNSVTASQIAAGAVTAAALTADAIDGRTIRGVTITGGTVTGGTVQTGASGARVVILPDISWLPNVKMPAIQLSTGISTETQPAMLRADPLAGRLLMSSPEFANGGWAYVDLNSATTPEENGHIEMGVGSPRSPRIWIGGDKRDVQIRVYSAEGAQLAYFLTDQGLEVQEDDLVRGWRPVSFANGCTQLDSWRTVGYRMRPDGRVALRGIVAVPDGMTDGLIGTIETAQHRPREGEVFAAATAADVGAKVYVQASGAIEVWGGSGPIGGWLSFGNIEWSVD
ncbi:hypothetical protein ACFZCK_04610 [Kitasatospora purpeofusca]|uniref:hypothetical protein n=1 Tax=Kitasatospora purpeofusca TaxID=67352 RepID=UPI0036E94E24